MAASTEYLSEYNRCEGTIALVLFTFFATVLSIPGVFIPRMLFFGDECCDSCTLWHVKASYIVVSMLPLLIMLVYTVVTQESGDPNDESSQELPTVQQSADIDTVATEDGIESDLHFEEDEDSLPRIT